MDNLDMLLEEYMSKLPNMYQELYSFFKNKRDPTSKLIYPTSANEILNIMNSAGLSNLQDQDTLYSIYSSSVASAMEDIPDMSDSNISYVSPETIKLAVEGTQIKMASISQRTISKIEDLIREASLLPIPLSVLSDKLKTETDILIGQAKTLVNTGLAQVQRESLVKQSEEDMLFLYVGSDDKLTRPFCKAIVGKVFSKKQIAKLNNKQGLGVLTNGGGYNCRHRWVPVTLQYVKLQELPLATSEDISEANEKATR